METRTWNTATAEDYASLIGKSVISRDGETLGEIKELVRPSTQSAVGSGGHFFLFKPGLMKSWFGGLDDAYLPEAAITSVTEDAVVIDLTEDQIREHRWDVPTEVIRPGV